MKKLLGIVVLGLLLTTNVNSSDKFLGKWISEKTKSVFEVTRENDEYKLYLLYSGRWFKEYKNEYNGFFKKKNVSYKGKIIFFDKDYNNYEVDASYKIKKGNLIIKAKGESPFTKEKVKTKLIFERFKDNDEYTKGETLFGIQIGDSIKNYKILTRINLGNDMVGYKEGLVIEAPEPHPEFETYIVETVKGTDQIYQIYAYLGANRQKLSWGRCESLMQPYRNFIIEKYEKKFIPMDKETLTFGGSITANTTTFALVDKNTNIYNYVLWTSCDEPFSDSIGDKGNYIARISLWHYDLMQLSWANERNKKNKKKKEF